MSIPPPPIPQPHPGPLQHLEQDSGLFSGAKVCSVYLKTLCLFRSCDASTREVAFDAVSRGLRVHTNGFLMAVKALRGCDYSVSKAWFYVLSHRNKGVLKSSGRISWPSHGRFGALSLPWRKSYEARPCFSLKNKTHFPERCPN